MNAASATSTAPQDPATGAAPEPITAAARARAEVYADQGDTPAPATSPAAKESLPPLAGRNAAELPMAVVVTVITADRITQHAHLHLGGLHTAVRDWRRTGNRSWTSRDDEFIASEERIGVELAEYADQMELPIRIANMLPHAPASADSEARQLAAVAAEELRHG